MTHRFATERTENTIETRLCTEEHGWLVTLLKRALNVAPTFHCPDRISACISLLFASDDAPARIFEFLGTELVLSTPEPDHGLLFRSR